MIRSTLNSGARSCTLRITWFRANCRRAPQHDSAGGRLLALLAIGHGAAIAIGCDGALASGASITCACSWRCAWSYLVSLAWRSLVATLDLASLLRSFSSRDRDSCISVTSEASNVAIFHMISDFMASTLGAYVHVAFSSTRSAAAINFLGFSCAGLAIGFDAAFLELGLSPWNSNNLPHGCGAT